MSDGQTSQKIVVIGGGQAGFSYAERIRALLPEATITMLCAEDTLPYQRPPLSKKYMMGEMTRDSLTFRTEGWFAENRIDVRTGVTVDSIDRSAQLVHLGKDALLYDRLMLATGSEPRRLPADIGGSLKNVFVMRSLADADAFGEQMAAGRKLVVIGGGYIGLEAAAVARKAGMDVTVVEAAPRILQRVACEETSTWFRDLHQRHGVKIVEKAGLEKLVGRDGTVSGAQLSDGQHLECDVALVGIGILPSTELAEQAGLEVENGIVVDGRGRTSDDNIFAAGDCSIFDFEGQQTRLESVQNAIEQAQHAALETAGQGKDYRPIPWFWSDQFDVTLQIAGLNRGYDKVVTRPGSREGAQSHWYFRNDKFIAVDAMNDPRAYLPGKKILETGGALTAEQAADPECNLKDLMRPRP
jgi:3-phenylpropionate/trans-cinnamate dioxygenase ferredoxin reductase subunit